jgi:hypothetical protein
MNALNSYSECKTLLFYRLILSFDGIKNVRFKYLKTLYEMAHANTKEGFDELSIAKESGMDKPNAILQYLMDEELVRGNSPEDALVGSLAASLIYITHKGVKEVEQASTNPQNPTEHFPPNIIYIAGDVTGSPIQQGSPYAKQSVSYDGLQHEKLIEIVNLLKGILNEHTLKKEEEAELYAEIQTIEAQSSSPKPKIAIIREGLSSAKTILEGVSTLAISATLVATKINSWLERIGVN